MKKTLLFFALLCAFAQGAWAQNYAYWDGLTREQPPLSGNNTILIQNAAQLAYARDHWQDEINNSYHYYDIDYYLEADLDLSAESWHSMGRGLTYFEYNGTFWGNGHSIKIRMEGGDQYYRGLFASIGEYGMVKNLHIEGIINVGNARLVGGIAGLNRGIIENCWVSADITSSHYHFSDNADLGGIVGENTNVLRYCGMTGNVTNTGNNSGVGGIVGSNFGGPYNNKGVRHCTFYGSVSVNHDQHNKYVGEERGGDENLYDEFNQSEYDNAIGMNMYRHAIKYPYAINVTTVGQGSLTVSAGGENNVPGARKGQEVTLTTPSGINADVTVTDADGNNVMLFGSSSASGYSFIMPKRDVNVHAVFSVPDWPRQGSGTANSPYLITSADDWNEFALSVNAGNTHNGKHVKLNSDISIWMMAGASETNSFQGTFDGDGHTLTVNYNTTAAVTAPFRFTKNATISNLRVAGTISTIAMQAAGIVAQANGSLNLTNCRSSVTINSNRESPGAYHGGLVGWVAGGGSATISGCVFDGALVSVEGTGKDTECGGFVAMSEGSTTITNSLLNPSSVSEGMVTGTFIGASLSNTITNCYYTQTLGTAQGSQVYSITGGTGVTVANAGAVGSNYNVSGLTFYTSGLKGGDMLYAVSGNSVSLTLGLNLPGYSASGFTPSAGTLTGTANPYTLTMPASDVTISTVWSLPTDENGNYLISSEFGWNLFCEQVAGGNNYSGKVIKLTNDISVTTMAGSSETNSFQGTFDGDGHTLTFNKSDFTDIYAAPFRCVGSATFRNLHVAGIINTTYQYAGGMIAWIVNGNTVSIQNCRSSMTINSSHHTNGGFVSRLGNNATLTISGCVFDGSFEGTGHANGGFVGYCQAGSSATLLDCLFKPDHLSSDLASCQTWVRGEATTSFTRCYYTQVYNAVQDGTASYFGTATAPSGLGNLVTDYGMVKAYDNGLLFNNKYYTAPSTGAGSASTPYIIDSEAALALLAQNVNTGVSDFLDKHFSLTCDLNLSGQNWMPIGTTDRPFKGNFNGNNHIIRNMAVNNPSGDYNGLFGWVEGDINYETNWTDPGSKYIKNFVVKNANVHGRNYTGGVAGRVHGELTFENVILDGATVQGANFTSGFIGSAEGDYQQSLYISNYSELHLNNCLFVNGSVTENTGHEGYDYVAPDHPHTSFVMFGNIQRYAIFNNNYFSNVTYNGGAAPEDYYNVQAYPITPDVSSNVSCNIYNTTGLSYNGSLYAPNNTTAHFSVYTQDLAQVITGVSVNSTQVGTTSGDYAFTVDSSQAQAYTITVALSATGITGSGDSEDDPYLITNTDQWNAFANYVSSGNNLGDKFVRLDANIDISQTIGLRSDKPFSGTFLGNGHTITASISSTTTGSGANEQGVAPFHYINGATIKDLTVAGSIASASYHTSGLVGFADGTNTIENCLVTATLNISSNYAGGIIGHGLKSNITIEGCVFAGTINGVDGDRSNIGGIWGWSDSGTPTLVSCLEAGTYTNIASMHPMGLQKNKGSITNCYYVNPQVGSPSNACTVSGAVQAVTDVDILPLGDPVAYNVSGITAYVNGISYGGNFYYNPDRNIKRTITGYGDEDGKWAFIASPVEGSIAPTEVNNLIGAKISDDPVLYNYDLFRLNSEQWENYVQHTGDFNIVNGNGYLYATQTTKNLVFSGIFNTENSKTVALSEGFNLVGNPFGVNAYVSKPFYQMNAEGTDIVAVENYDTYTPVTIPPCTGIVVRATGADEVTFSTSAPQQQSSANNGNLQMTLTKASVRNDAVQDKAIVSFNENSLLEKFVFNERHAKLYIPQYGEDYAIASSEMTGELPLNFKTRETGRYTIGFNFENVKGVRIQLVDKLEDRIIDLNANDHYTFMGSVADRDDRFTLVFTKVETDGVFAYQSGNDIIVSGEGELQVFDVMGRMVMNQHINGVQTVEKPSTTGVYIFRLNGMSQKIVVK